MVMFLVTLGDPNHPNFYILRCLSYFRRQWMWRLQIWYTGWL